MFSLCAGFQTRWLQNIHCFCWKYFLVFGIMDQDALAAAALIQDHYTQLHYERLAAKDHLPDRLSQTIRLFRANSCSVTKCRFEVRSAGYIMLKWNRGPAWLIQAMSIVKIGMLICVRFKFHRYRLRRVLVVDRTWRTVNQLISSYQDDFLKRHFCHQWYVRSTFIKSLAKTPCKL